MTLPSASAERKRFTATVTVTVVVVVLILVRLRIDSSLIRRSSSGTRDDDVLPTPLSTALLEHAAATTNNTTNNNTKNNINTATTQTPTVRRGRVYYCGYKQPLAEYLFPDHDYRGDAEWSLSSDVEVHATDVLVVGMWGPSCNEGKGDERTSFAGKILYINGEPDGDPIAQEWAKHRARPVEEGGVDALAATTAAEPATADRIYQIGPYPPKTESDELHPELRHLYETQSLLVYHAVIEFLGNIYLPRRRKASALRDEREESPERPSASAFDPWKQLVEGNGRSAAPDDDELPRIPAVVYVSRNCVGYRQEAAKLLSEHFRDHAPNALAETGEGARKTPSFVHYGGRCEVEGGIPIPPTILEGWENGARDRLHSNYATIYTRYKYCLVLENTHKAGYVTEKLMHALLGGCLPIYSGSAADAALIFRDDAYIYWDADHPEIALAEIRSLEADDAAYRHRTDRSRSLLRVESGADTASTVEAYFSLLPGVGRGTLGRTLHERMGLPVPESLRSSS